MSEPVVRSYEVRICDQCYALEGEMCHNPECVFCRRTMAEVREYLDATLIRPIVDGEPLDLHPLTEPPAPALAPSREERLKKREALRAEVRDWVIQNKTSDGCGLYDAHFKVHASTAINWIVDYLMASAAAPEGLAEKLIASLCDVADPFDVFEGNGEACRFCFGRRNEQHAVRCVWALAKALRPSRATAPRAQGSHTGDHST